MQFRPSSLLAPPRPPPAPQAQPAPSIDGNPEGARGIDRALVFDTFAGLNTASSRPAIEETQCSWIDGFFPLGKSNARTMPGIGPALYAATATGAVVYFDFGNIGAMPVCIVFLRDGSLVQINTDTRAVTTIAPPGTITNPSVTSVSVTQSGSQYIIITAAQTNGLFLWDGVNLFEAGTLGPDVTIGYDGIGYSSDPTITAFGGSGSGATFGVSVSNGGVNTISVTNPGTGYTGTDAVILAFSGGGSAGRTATALGVVGSGTLSSVSLVDAGLGYTSSVTGTVLGGGGAGATVSVTASGGSVSGVTVVLPGSGYVTAPVIEIIDPNNPVARATVDVMPSGVGGSTGQTYQSHLWIGNGSRIQLSAPESLVDFSTANGGGAFKSTDPFLRVAWSALVQTNGFLYLVADSSVNYISGVQTNTPQGGSPTTTYTNQNADPEVGSPWPPSVGVISENVIFGNAFGVHVTFGGRVSKISTALDGVYNSVPNFGGLIPSSCKAIVYGRRIWAILIPIVNPVTGQPQNKLFCWEPETKRWFATSQDVELVYVKHQEISSVLTAYGTDGTTIYPLFQQPSTAFTKTIQSKLWDNPHYMFQKTQSRLWGMAYYFSALSPGLDVSIDNENGVANNTVDVGLQIARWVNDVGAAATWRNGSGAVAEWLVLGLGVVIFEPQAVAQTGVLAGLTLTTSAADMTLISLTIDNNTWTYRG